MNMGIELIHKIYHVENNILKGSNVGSITYKQSASLLGNLPTLIHFASWLKKKTMELYQ